MLGPGAAELVATMAIGGLAAVGWRSAALWFGWPVLVPPTEVEVVVPRRRSPTPWPGARIIRQTLHANDVVRVRGVAITRPLRTALDLAFHLPLVEAVAVLDGATRMGGVSLAALRRELLRAERPKAQQIAGLVDPARGSVYESVFFLLVALAGLPTPVCQHEVRHNGSFVARADFAWLHRRVIVEIDGFAHHSDRAAFHADRRRQNALVNAGWRVLRFTPADLIERPDAVVREVRAALGLHLTKINAAMIMV